MVIADDADGADDVFWPRADPDHSGSSSAFTTEGDVDTQYPKERLRTTQAAPRPRGVLGPTSGPARGGRELECGFTFRREPADLISMSSQVTRVSGPGAGSCGIEGPNPRFAPR